MWKCTIKKLCDCDSSFFSKYLNLLYSPFLFLWWCGLTKPTWWDEVRWMIVSSCWPLMTSQKVDHLSGPQLTKGNWNHGNQTWIRGNYYSLCYAVMKDICIETKLNFCDRAYLGKSRFLNFNSFFEHLAFFYLQKNPTLFTLKSIYCLTTFWTNTI